MKSQLPAVGLAILVAAAIASGAAQESRPVFDVVSVKESPPPVATGGGFSISLFIGPRPGGRFEANNATLFRLLQYAYDGFSLPGQIVGGPPWTDAFDARFNVNALAAGDPAPALIREMVKTMLADRFKLKARIEPREMDVYALVLARRDGTLGRGLRPSTVDCEAAAAARKGGDGSVRTCGMSSQSAANGSIRYQATSASMASVASFGQSAAGRPIIDRTGLTGRYDVEIEFVSGRVGGVPSPDSTAPSIFTALQEELGLKLEPAKEKIDVLVIEQAERPTPD